MLLSSKPKEDMNTLLSDFRALDLVILRGQTFSLLFCPERFVLMKLSDEGLAAAELALAVDCSDTLEDDKNINLFLQTAVNYVSAFGRVEISSTELALSMSATQTLPKLVLMVNNYCNLKCAYCYEHGTAFKDPARCITQSSIRTTIDKCYEFFNAIGTVMFIGGEPTLSENAIEEACEYSLSKASILKREKPTFGMITNGVKISEYLHQVIDRYEIQVTFSVDGPKATNDLVRIRHDGSGSYDALSANIKRYARNHPDKLSIESTVTRAQSETGLSVSELLTFISDEFGVNTPHIAIAGLPTGHPLMPIYQEAAGLDKDFSAAIDLSVINILADMTSGDSSFHRPRISFVADMMRALASKSATIAMCSAGTAQIVVDSRADVYPCWMFAGNAAFRMGNIVSDSIVKILGSSVVSRVRSNTKMTNANCSKCYARFVCHACIGNNQNTTGAIEKMDPRFCDTTRNSLVTILSAIVTAHADPEQWKKIILAA